MKNCLFKLLCLFIAFTSFSHAQLPEDLPIVPPKKKIRVAVTLMPQKEFVRAVGGDRVSIVVMVPHGATPSHFVPIKYELLKAKYIDMYVRMGHLMFEKDYLQTIAGMNPKVKFLNSSAHLLLKDLTETGTYYDSERHQVMSMFEAHNRSIFVEMYGSQDPHVWLSPVLVKEQVKQIYEGLVAIDPESSSYFKQNMDRYLAKLTALDAQIRKDLTGLNNHDFLVFHPYFGYFAKTYGLKQHVVEYHGQRPSPKQMKNIVRYAKENEIKFLITDLDFSHDTAKALAEAIEGAVIPVNPTAPEYIEGMRAFSKKLAEALK